MDNKYMDNKNLEKELEILENQLREMEETINLGFDIDPKEINLQKDLISSIKKKNVIKK